MPPFASNVTLTWGMSISHAGSAFTLATKSPMPFAVMPGNRPHNVGSLIESKSASSSPNSFKLVSGFMARVMRPSKSAPR